jgi:hypothetical protein
MMTLCYVIQISPYSAPNPLNVVNLPIGSTAVPIEFQIQVIVAFTLAAVHFIQPLTHSGLLVKHSTIET